MSSVSCVNLCKTYRQGDQDIKALDHVSLEIEEGEFVSGCIAESSEVFLTSSLSGIQPECRCGARDLPAPGPVDWGDGRSGAQAHVAGRISWIEDDAVSFVRREVRRERTYDGILLDPPPYGRGPSGEKWVFEEGITELLAGCRALLLMYPQ